MVLARHGGLATVDRGELGQHNVDVVLHNRPEDAEVVRREGHETRIGVGGHQRRVGGGRVRLCLHARGELDEAVRHELVEHQRVALGVRAGPLTLREEADGVAEAQKVRETARGEADPAKGLREGVLLVAIVER